MRGSVGHTSRHGPELCIALYYYQSLPQDLHYIISLICSSDTRTQQCHIHHSIESSMRYGVGMRYERIHGRYTPALAAHNCPITRTGPPSLYKPPQVYPHHHHDSGAHTTTHITTTGTTLTSEQHKRTHMTTTTTSSSRGNTKLRTQAHAKKNEHANGTLAQNCIRK